VITEHWAWSCSQCTGSQQLSPGSRLPLLFANLESSPYKHSPDGATIDEGGELLISAHYSFIDPERMKG